MRKDDRAEGLSYLKMGHMGGIEDWMPRVVRLAEATLKRENASEYERFIKFDFDEKRDYVLNNWENLSIKADPECIEKMNHILHPLLENTVKNGKIEEIKEYFAPKLASSTKSTIDLHMAMSRSPSDGPDRTDSENIQSLLASYLNLFSGLFCTQVNIIVWANTLNGKEYYRLDNGNKTPRRLEKFIKVQKEIDHYKLAYLSSEGFQSVTEACDKDLRNAIAHNDYDVLDDRGISYHSQALGLRVILDLIDLKERRLKLIMMIGCINESMKMFYMDWATKRVMESLLESDSETPPEEAMPNTGDEALSDSDDS